MQMQRALSLGTVTLLGFTVLACADPTSGSQPNESLHGATASNARTVSAPAVRPDVGVDSEFASLASEIPGFGGLVYDRDGTPIVYLVDQGQQALARTTIASRMSQLNAKAAAMQFRDAQFDFAKLYAWRQALPPVLALKGVLFLDVDEAANRIRIGVANATAADRVRAALVSLKVPMEAVLITEAKPFQALAALTDYTRPPVGGLQIAVPYTSDPQGAGFYCTLGFNAYQYADTSIGFVTNSHCTKTQGGVEYSNYYQPDYSSNGNLIGVEIADPTYLTGGTCPTGRRCRYSDAAFATYYPIKGTIGKIARTTERGSSSGPLTIDPAMPRFTIISETAYPHMGETIDKIGRTTGWTSGTVTSSCTDINVADSDVTLLCQDLVAAGSDHGDSGSPVFYYYGDTPLGPDAISLVGILWGGDGSGTFAMSEFGNVQWELNLSRAH